jgi:F0F1-type ATP synthase membrane subunit b/b'
MSKIGFVPSFRVGQALPPANPQLASFRHSKWGRRFRLPTLNWLRSVKSTDLLAPGPRFPASIPIGFVSLFLCTALPALAQEGGNKSEAGSQEIWLIANFLILAISLGMLIAKSAGPYFQKRLGTIREDIVRGEQARQEAERNAADVDRRLANLEMEIADLRAEAHKEFENEKERMRQRMAAERERVREQASQEIAAAGKTARAELKRYSAELAIGLAERKIRARMNPDTQDSLIGSFVEILNGPQPEGPAVQG